MLVAIIYPPKEPLESWIVEVDFAELMVEGETISTCTCTSKRRADGTTSTSTFCSGPPAPSGTVVRQRIIAGADGETHRMQFGIVTPSPYSNTWYAEVDVPVKDLSR